jgi:GNAT superfamily N-acetyltransferase
MGKMSIRMATPEDFDAVLDFNRRLAAETEGKSLSLEVVSAGVRAALADRSRLAYWVAEIQGDVVGQAAVSREWSDWRNGWIWWFQSVYVKKEVRGKGVFRGLFDAVEKAARAENAIGLRLYVEKNNTAAQKTYDALGMKEGDYVVFEQFFIELP